MATHCSVLSWRILGMVEPGGLPSTGSHRVGHDWSDLAAAAAAAAVAEAAGRSKMSCHVPWWIIILQLQSYSFYKGMCVCNMPSHPHPTPITSSSSIRLLQHGPGAYLLLGWMLSYEKPERYIPCFSTTPNHEDAVVTFVLPEKITEGILEVPVIQFKAKVIPTTSSLKGFAEEISIIRLQGWFSCPILKRNCPQ